MNRLDHGQSEGVTADLLFARVMQDYDYWWSKDSLGAWAMPWWGPLSETIASALLLWCFGALDQAIFDLSRIIADARQGRQ